MNPLDLAKHMEGCIAVLSALGQHGLQISAMTFYEDSIKSIVSAMRNANIKRLICMTSFYTKCREKKISFFICSTEWFRSTGKISIYISIAYSSNDWTSSWFNVYYGTVSWKWMSRFRLYYCSTTAFTRWSYDWWVWNFIDFFKVIW